MLLRRQAAMLHRHMRAMRRALLLADRTIPDFPEGFHELDLRLHNLDQDFENARSSAPASFMTRSTPSSRPKPIASSIALSALTAAFLPPALVAGLFGMNFVGCHGPTRPMASGSRFALRPFIAWRLVSIAGYIDRSQNRAIKPTRTCGCFLCQSVACSYSACDGAKHRHIVEHASDHMKSGRQTRLGEAAGHARGRLLRQIERIAERRPVHPFAGAIIGGRQLARPRRPGSAESASPADHSSP